MIYEGNSTEESVNESNQNISKFKHLNSLLVKILEELNKPKYKNQLEQINLSEHELEKHFIDFYVKFAIILVPKREQIEIVLNRFFKQEEIHAILDVLVYDSEITEPKVISLITRHNRLNINEGKPHNRRKFEEYYNSIIYLN